MKKIKKKKSMFTRYLVFISFKGEVPVYFGFKTKKKAEHFFYTTTFDRNYMGQIYEVSK
jgi:hypothetical protein